MIRGVTGTMKENSLEMLKPVKDWNILEKKVQEIEEPGSIITEIPIIKSNTWHVCVIKSCIMSSSIY